MAHQLISAPVHRVASSASTTHIGSSTSARTHQILQTTARCYGLDLPERMVAAYRGGLAGQAAHVQFEVA